MNIENIAKALDRSGSIIERNVKLHHGIEDYDFDERVWDYTDSKKHVRLVLKDIK